MNFFASCEAPPIRNPSIFLIILNSLIFFGFTDPPYKTLLLFALFFIKLMVFNNSPDFGITPVPIDQTGSYAIIIFLLF